MCLVDVQYEEVVKLEFDHYDVFFFLMFVYRFMVGQNRVYFGSVFFID